jgi:site-specific recombinase XerD
MALQIMPRLLSLALKGEKEKYLVASDYATEKAFYTKLDGYLQSARQQGWVGERTIVVWPEHIGSWLIAVDESQAVLHATSLSAAMRPLVLRHVIALIRKLVAAREKDRVVASLFRMKAEKIGEHYQAIGEQFDCLITRRHINPPLSYQQSIWQKRGGL